MISQRLLLPIDEFLPEIAHAVQTHSSVIIVAEPGAGKTTRVPVALVQEMSALAKNKKWIVLQPRRWAAKLTAQRIAEENHWKLGEEVGYQVRFESKVSKNTRIHFMTEGVLLRKLLQDPELDGVAGIILDEFHERSLDLDLALALLREIQESFREDLKIVVMSATLDPAPLEKFLAHSKVFQIAGKVFPVQRKYFAQGNVLSAVKLALHETDRDILIFLPGAYEIERNLREIRNFLEDEGFARTIDALPLYASLPEPEQKKIFAEGSRRKIILSTNIAETSLTLPGVKAVIDSGWAKVMRTDPQLGQDRLETVRISKASSDQRAGRAGRVSAGVCYRLWGEGEQSQLRHFETPEIHRVSLSSALLFLSDFGVKDFQKFGWYESPRASMLEYSLRELHALGFFIDNKITESGKKALAYPLSPQLAKLLIEAEKLNLKDFAARFSAFLETRGAPGSENSIQTEEQLLFALNRLSGSALQSAKQIFGLHSVPEVKMSDWPQYEKVLARSLKSQIFVQDRLVGRRQVRFKDGSKAIPQQGLVLSSLEKTEKGIPTVVIQNYVPLSRLVLEKESKKQSQVFWDPDLNRVRKVEGVFFEDLELGHVTDGAPSPAEIESILAQVVLKNPRELLAKNENFNAWLIRAEFYQKNCTDQDAVLQWNWEELLQIALSSPALAGKAKLDAVLAYPFQDSIEGLLDRGTLNRFHASVPEKIEVPSGSFIKIDYSGDKPKLSVRLQEIFGMLDTPQIMGNRIPLLIELLAPNFKPIQVTQDLRSFWKGAYFEVKKELKARYPKHAWPEDPLTAKPEAKGRRRN